MAASDIELAVNAALAERDIEPQAFRERAGTVLILGSVTATGAEWGAVSRVRDGAVVSLRHFDSHAEALAVAGEDPGVLRPPAA